MNRISILLTLFVLNVAAVRGLAQTTDSIAMVPGVRLAINLSNSVVAVGSTNFVHCLITNASTNAIFIFETGGPKVDFGFSLIDHSGKMHNLKQQGPMRVIFRNVSINIPPGGKHESELEIRLDKSIKPGSYRLEVRRRYVFANGKKTGPPDWQEVVSNLLDLQVK
jgi:hypothetical protein